MKHVSDLAKGREETVVLPSKKTFQGAFFPVCSLVLHFAPVHTECSLSVSHNKGEPFHRNRPLNLFQGTAADSLCI